MIKHKLRDPSSKKGLSTIRKVKEVLKNQVQLEFPSQVVWLRLRAFARYERVGTFLREKFWVINSSSKQKYTPECIVLLIIILIRVEVSKIGLGRIEFDIYLIFNKSYIRPRT